jgi:hypothetical protein
MKTRAREDLDIDTLRWAAEAAEEKAREVTRQIGYTAPEARGPIEGRVFGHKELARYFRQRATVIERRAQKALADAERAVEDVEGGDPLFEDGRPDPFPDAVVPRVVRGVP